MVLSFPLVRNRLLQSNPLPVSILSNDLCCAEGSVGSFSIDHVSRRLTGKFLLSLVHVDASEMLLGRGHTDAC